MEAIMPIADRVVLDSGVKIAGLPADIVVDPRVSAYLGDKYATCKL